MHHLYNRILYVSTYLHLTESFIYFFVSETVSLCHPGWSAVATSASCVQVILLPQPPEWLGFQPGATTPS